MSGVYIPGIEMPKEGWITLRIYPSGDVGIIVDRDCRYHDVAIPVPAHGDLIDRGETLKKIRPWSQEDEYAACTFDTVKKLMHTLLNDSPTIIPADPAEEDE